MEVTLTQIRYGPGYFQDAGMTMELPNDEAMRLIASGAAVPVRSHKVETATIAPMNEHAAQRATKRGKHHVVS